MAGMTKAAFLVGGEVRTFAQLRVGSFGRCYGKRLAICSERVPGCVAQGRGGRGQRIQEHLGLLRTISSWFDYLIPHSGFVFAVQFYRNAFFPEQRALRASFQATLSGR